VIHIGVTIHLYVKMLMLSASGNLVLYNKVSASFLMFEMW